MRLFKSRQLLLVQAEFFSSSLATSAALPTSGCHDCAYEQLSSLGSQEANKWNVLVSEGCCLAAGMRHLE